MVVLQNKKVWRTGVGEVPHRVSPPVGNSNSDVNALASACCSDNSETLRFSSLISKKKHKVAGTWSNGRGRDVLSIICTMKSTSPEVRNLGLHPRTAHWSIEKHKGNNQALPMTMMHQTGAVTVPFQCAALQHSKGVLVTIITRIVKESKQATGTQLSPIGRV